MLVSLRRLGDTCCTCALLQKDTLQVERLLQKGEQRLKEKLHPDPIIGVPLALSAVVLHSPCLRHLHQWVTNSFGCLCWTTAQLAPLLTSLSPTVPYYPGGSLFERNPPMPKVCSVSYNVFLHAWAIATLHAVLKIDSCMQMQQHLDFGREGYH